MNNSSNDFENILRSKITQFSSYLISKCDNNDQIKMIEDKIGSLRYYEILMFITFLDSNKLDNYINDLINTVNIPDNEEIRYEIKEYLKWFMNVREILNDSMKK
jgi:Ca2+-binding EF-hand superfamily protein